MVLHFFSHRVLIWPGNANFRSLGSFCQGNPPDKGNIQTAKDTTNLVALP